MAIEILEQWEKCTISRLKKPDERGLEYQGVGGVTVADNRVFSRLGFAAFHEPSEGKITICPTPGANIAGFRAQLQRLQEEEPELQIIFS